MIKNFNEIEEQLKKLAPTINAFKSEAVQLKIVELIFSNFTLTPDQNPDSQKSGGDPKGKPGSSKKKKQKSLNKKKAKQPAKSSGRPGPGKMIDTLIAEGFFSKSRGASDIVSHCKDNKVLTYKNSEIAVSLGRAVKSDKLKREKNADGQFGYSIP